MAHNQLNKQIGFTLIEVLVALLIMSIGLLGLAALQATSLKASHGAYSRGQAVFLAYDMMDRMRANRTQALAGAYDRNYGDAPPAVSGILSDDDLNDWIFNFVRVLLPGNNPGGDASIACIAATGVCTVTLQWDESRLGGDASNNNNLINFSFISQI